MNSTWDNTKEIAKRTFREWREDDALQWGAALAFYAIFSLAPVLLIGIAVASVMFGESGVRSHVFDQVQALIGQRGAELLQEMVARAAEQGGTIWATVLGGVALLVGATTVFAQLKVALNRMWDVRSKVEGVWGFVRKRILAFTMVAVIGFLLLVSLLASAALSAFDAWLIELSGAFYWLLRILSLMVSFGMVTLLFAFIFKVLPDVKIQWRDVWLGALATAALFTAGQWAIGFYIGNSSTASAYGAAGSLVAVLLWVYFSSQILLLGAEFTQVYARHRGSGLEPTDDAQRIA